MNRSDSIAALAEAFVAFQGDAKNPPKTAKVDTGKFSYAFAPLPEILEAVRPLLAKHGLAVAQELTTDKDGEVGAATLLMHKSGEWIAFAPLFVPGGADARDHGGAASYARRYALLAALNLSTADDDASAPPARKPAQRRSAPAKPQGEAASPQGEVMVTDRQTAKIAAEAAACGITDEQLAKALQRDFHVETTGELTRDQASKLIARLMKRHEEIDEGIDHDEEQARADEAPGMDAEEYRNRRDDAASSDGHIF